MRNLDEAIKLIKKFEGFRSKAYRDPIGIWTIGYGTIRYSNGKPVQRGDVISESEASKYIVSWLHKNAIPVVNREVKVTLNDNQYNALLSFVYNVGPGNFKRSTLLKKINFNDMFGAAKEFNKWVYAGGKKFKGLERRRKEERALFEKSVQEIIHPNDPIETKPGDIDIKVPEVPNWFKQLIDFLVKIFVKQDGN